MHTLEQLRSGALKGTTRLDLSENLTLFPPEILDLADTLEILNLTNNQLSSLPKEFGKLQKLKIIFCADNAFTTIPTVLADCPKLSMIAFKSNAITKVPKEAFPLSTQWLILTNNQITTLPQSMGNLHKLQKLALAGNQLTSLPKSMKQCQALELIRLSANQLTHFPSWLYTLPNLAYLAYSGNPFCQTKDVHHTLPQIGFNELYFETQIGEGASGIISKGSHQKKDVAIKVFKGDITSDGYPKDEMNAAIVAGEHPNLIDIMGNLQAHPEQKMGLVLALIPSHYKSLGYPPSLQTCTRDTFVNAPELHLTQIISILKGITNVVGHLHQKGVMHGDMYAHNTLIDDKGHAILGDFGAASFTDTLDAFLLERIEVRALGYMIEDLLLAHNASNSDLENLQKACLHPTIKERPSFAEISKVLEAL
jgi:hypothetical protein